MSTIHKKFLHSPITPQAGIANTSLKHKGDASVWKPRIESMFDNMRHTWGGLYNAPFSKSLKICCLATAALAAGELTGSELSAGMAVIIEGGAAFTGTIAVVGATVGTVMVVGAIEGAIPGALGAAATKAAATIITRVAVGMLTSSITAGIVGFCAPNQNRA